jgi:hypothetical protein
MGQNIEWKKHRMGQNIEWKKRRMEKTPALVAQCVKGLLPW